MSERERRINLKRDPFFEYFLVLDRDVLETTRYVDLSEKNYDTYSFEYLRLLFSICAEFEIVCQELCSLIEPSKSFDEAYIDDLTKIILEKFPNIVKLEIDVPQLSTGSGIFPFEGWQHNGRKNVIKPFWWDNHTKVKHGRHKNFEKANLKSVLYSLAGLYGILIYLQWFKSKDGNVYFNDMPKAVFYDYGNLFKPFLGGRKCELPDSRDEASIRE
jgi:hypothetical protein